MKYIKEFKLIKETGEWTRGVDLEYALANPDDDSQEAHWIRQMYDELNMIRNELNNPKNFKIIDIKGFDMYQGPYGKVKIFGKVYDVWCIGENKFWIDDFPINNMDEDENPGFKGFSYVIVALLNDIEEGGGIELYKDTQKYNL